MECAWIGVSLGVLLVLVIGYLSACAGAERWLTVREWWIGK